MDMKKIFALALAALAALVSCQKESNFPEPQPQPQSKIVFELTASYSDESPATKAIKTGWEGGDVIFVFFEGVEAPKHLQMRYDGTAWTTVEMNGDTEGAIGLSNGNEGLMRALYLPFGSDSKISTDNSNSRFFIDNNNPFARESYWLTGTLHYVVINNKVSGAFNMTIPEGFVQFYVEDPDAATKLAGNDEYTLSCPAVTPCGINAISATGLAIERNYVTGDPTYAGYEMSANAYKGGFLFSGCLVDEENYLNTYGNRYYLRRTFWEYNGIMTPVETKDLYVNPLNPLVSHDAVLLPSYDSPRWMPVRGSNSAVELSGASGSLGAWKIKNYGDYVPAGSEYLATFNFQTANALGEKVPSREEWLALINGLTWTPIVVDRGIKGMLGVDKDGKYIFLQDGWYWTSTLKDETTAFSVLVEASSPVDKVSIIFANPTQELAVRAMAGPTDPILNTFNPEITY